jgi:hypothetical protein
MLDGMQPLHAVRAAVLVLVVAALALTIVVLARLRTPPLVIVIELPSPSVSVLAMPVGLRPYEQCQGYDRWRHPTDPRWWCGLD